MSTSPCTPVEFSKPVEVGPLCERAPCALSRIRPYVSTATERHNWVGCQAMPQEAQARGGTGHGVVTLRARLSAASLQSDRGANDVRLCEALCRRELHAF
jgi:hypothetical protein